MRPDIDQCANRGYTVFEFRISLLAYTVYSPGSGYVLRSGSSSLVIT